MQPESRSGAAKRMERMGASRAGGETEKPRPIGRGFRIFLPGGAILNEAAVDLYVGADLRRSDAEQRLGALRDFAGDERGVVAHSADERGVEPVQEAQSEEIEPRHLRDDAALMARIAIVAEHRQLDPPIVGPET